MADKKQKPDFFREDSDLFPESDLSLREAVLMLLCHQGLLDTMGKLHPRWERRVQPIEGKAYTASEAAAKQKRSRAAKAESAKDDDPDALQAEMERLADEAKANEAKASAEKAK